MFEPGQLVECVDDHFVGSRPSPIRRGGIYTVLETGPMLSFSLGQYDGCGDGIWLQEVTNPYTTGGEFAAPRFRPVRGERLDIFRSMLEPQRTDFVLIEEVDGTS